MECILRTISIHYYGVNLIHVYIVPPQAQTYCKCAMEEYQYMYNVPGMFIKYVHVHVQHLCMYMHTCGIARMYILRIYMYLQMDMYCTYSLYLEDAFLQPSHEQVKEWLFLVW